jgi:hypothetical protein
MADANEPATVDAPQPASSQRGRVSTATVAVPELMTEQEVEQYLGRDVWPQMRWYEEEANRVERALSFWFWIGIGFGFLATTLAAIPPHLYSREWIDRELLRWLAVVASAVATVASGTIVPRYRRLATTREMGRVKTTAVEKRARIMLSHVAMTKEQRAKELSKYADELIAIEADYGAPDRAQGGRA